MAGLFNPANPKVHANEAQRDALLNFMADPEPIDVAVLRNISAQLAYAGLDVVHIHQLMLARTNAARGNEGEGAQTEELNRDLLTLLTAGIVRGTKTTKIRDRSANSADFNTLVGKYQIQSTENAGTAKAKDVITIARLMATYATKVANIIRVLGRGQSPGVEATTCPIWLQFVAGVSLIPIEGEQSELFDQWCQWYARFCTLYRLPAFDAANPGQYVAAARTTSLLTDAQRRQFIRRMTA